MPFGGCASYALEDICLTLQHADEIRAYEQRRRAEAPWLWRNGNEGVGAMRRHRAHRASRSDTLDDYLERLAARLGGLRAAPHQLTLLTLRLRAFALNAFSWG